MVPTSVASRDSVERTQARMQQLGEVMRTCTGWSWLTNLHPVPDRVEGGMA